MAANFSVDVWLVKRFTDTSEQVILHMSLRVMYWSLRLSSTRSRATTLWSTLLTNTSRSPVRVKASATSWRILNGPPVHRERIWDVCVRGGTKRMIEIFADCLLSTVLYRVVPNSQTVTVLFNYNVYLERIVYIHKWEGLCELRGRMAKTQQTSQLHPGQLFFPRKKKSCPRWDSNPRHSTV